MSRNHRTGRTTRVVLSYLDSDLPCPVDDLHELAATYRHLLALEPGPMPTPPPTRQDAIRAATRATIAAAGKPKTTGPDMAAYDEQVTAAAAHGPALDRHRASVEVLNAALAVTEQDINDVLVDHASAVLGALQTHLDAMLDELRTTVAPKVANLSVVAALRAGDDVAAAFHRFEQMTADYGTMRGVQQIVAPVTRDGRDWRGEFNEFRNVASFYTPSRTVGIESNPPWPTDDTGAFLLWVAAHPEVELWLPTAAQRDEAHAAAYPTGAFRPTPTA